MIEVGERRDRALDALGGPSGPSSALDARNLCVVCRDVTRMTGAGVMLMSGDVPRGSVCTTDEVSASIEQLQYTLGEGPCVDAYNLSQPVLEPDLVEPMVTRWQAFSGPAIAAGARAIFGFPLLVGGIRLGALNLYRDRAGPLDADQHADSLVMAAVVAQAVLSVQAGAAPGRLAAELEQGADFQYVVHQASGVLAVQLGVSVAQALIRLRAYAFGNDLALTDVAVAVVAHTLRLDRDGEDAG